MMSMDRREFICKGALAAALGGLAIGGCGRSSSGVVAGAPPTAPSSSSPAASVARAAGRVGANRIFEAPPGGCHAAVAAGKSPEELIKAAIEAFGGQDLIIKRGDTVVIKPNLAWAREPEFAANTNPKALAATIRMAKDAGAAKVIVADHPCDSSAIAFEMCGAKEICESLGVPLVALETEARYQECDLGGKYVKQDAIAREILECDVYINMPCLKHHGATEVSLGIKNQLGVNWDRQQHHRAGKDSGADNLHQNIADLARIVRPTLVILDATWALKSNGPKGPGDVEETKTIIVSHDIVTVDALGAEMLGHRPLDIPHIRLAADAGVGSASTSSLEISRV